MAEVEISARNGYGDGSVPRLGGRCTMRLGQTSPNAPIQRGRETGKNPGAGGSLPQPGWTGPSRVRMGGGGILGIQEHCRHLAGGGPVNGELGETRRGGGLREMSSHRRQLEWDPLGLSRP